MHDLPAVAAIMGALFFPAVRTRPAVHTVIKPLPAVLEVVPLLAMLGRALPQCPRRLLPAMEGERSRSKRRSVESVKAELKSQVNWLDGRESHCVCQRPIRALAGPLTHTIEVTPRSDHRFPLLYSRLETPLDAW